MGEIKRLLSAYSAFVINGTLSLSKVNFFYLFLSCCIFIPRKYRKPQAVLESFHVVITTCHYFNKDWFVYLPLNRVVAFSICNGMLCNTRTADKFNFKPYTFSYPATDFTSLHFTSIHFESVNLKLQLLVAFCLAFQQS